MPRLVRIIIVSAASVVGVCGWAFIEMSIFLLTNLIALGS